MSLNVHYYDNPEGKDFSGKMFVTNKYAVIAGFGWGTIDCLFLSHPQGYLPTLARYIHYTVPFMGMATAFTSATYAANKIRGTDDKLNYVIGAMASGGVYGAWKRSVLAGCISGGVFSIMGILKKMSIEDGWKFFPEVRRHGSGGVFSVRHDWTLMAERPRNWTTGDDKE